MRKPPLGGSGAFPLSIVAIVLEQGSVSEAVEEEATRLRVEDVVRDGVKDDEIWRRGEERRRLEVYEYY